MVRIPGIRTFRLGARRVANLFAARAMILLYHRVADLPRDPLLLSVSPAHFSEHLAILRRQCYPIALAKTSEPQAVKKQLRKSVIITFDDGYADNLVNAKPLLERYEVPATVFVTTGYVSQQRSFWWDELESLLLGKQRLPEFLHLNIAGVSYQWQLSRCPENNYSISGQDRWNVSQPESATPRQLVYRSLQRLLRPLPEESRRDVLDELRRWANGASIDAGHSAPLSVEEVIQLASGGLVEVGAHTVTHPVLSTISVDAQFTEIQQSKKYLEEILGFPVTSFAYPFGARSDYTEETVAATRRAGFMRACSNFPGLIGPDADVYQLPRFLVRDWDGEEFSRRLRSWLSS
jgi:peptidoglycan/xylan/chitin deacetylase (PgdA/CDA1 family)